MRALLALAFAFLPTAAPAHAGHAGMSAFLPGLLHPLGGLDHVLAMLAIGVLAFAMGGRSLLVLPLSFLATMLLGFGLDGAALPLPLVETGIAFSAIVLGGAALTRRQLPLPAAAALTGLFGLFHGYAHGAEMPALASAPGYAGGFLAATLLLHLAGLGAAGFAARLHPRLPQLAGAAIAAAGTALLAGWL